MEAHATVSTEKAHRYMKALVNHFARKVSAEYEADHGFIDFGFGRCDIEASASAMTFNVSSSNAGNLQQVQQVIGSHVARFTQQEIVDLPWVN